MLNNNHLFALLKEISRVKNSSPKNKSELTVFKSGNGGANIHVRNATKKINQNI